MAGQPEITSVHAIFIRLETRQGHNAWGCTIAHPALTGTKIEDALRISRDCAAKMPDLHPLNIEQTWRSSARWQRTPFGAVRLRLALRDLLSAAGMPLYRLGGSWPHLARSPSHLV
jgi:hypothetical protein